MYIKDEIKLFIKVGVSKEYSALVRQTHTLNSSLLELAKAVTYKDELILCPVPVTINLKDFTCLTELQVAFKNKSGGELGLWYFDNFQIISDKEVYKPEYWWTINNFYIRVINPEISNICKDDLLSVV